MTYCECETPIIDVEHDAGCRRCGRPVDFSPTRDADYWLGYFVSALVAIAQCGGDPETAAPTMRGIARSALREYGEQGSSFGGIEHLAPRSAAAEADAIAAETERLRTNPRPMAPGHSVRVSPSPRGPFSRESLDAIGAAEGVTFCEHGVSHQPGEPLADGRSTWCGECIPA